MTPDWLKRLMERKDITDICLNGPGEIFVDQGDGLRPHSVAGESESWNETALRTWILEQLSLCGKSWDAKHPFVDVTLPIGYRMHAAFPPLAQKGILVSLRRLAWHAQSASDPNISTRWQKSGLHYEHLVKVVRSGESLLISGATGSGKTTLANDLLSEVPVTERIIALEDTPELQPRHPHFVSMISRPPNADGCGEVTLRTLLRQSLRMRPDRIILGECRGPEVLDLLQALNTGHHGALATLHANSPREALRRIELLCLLAGPANLQLGAIRELLVLGIQWIAQVRKEGRNRLIGEVWKIEGREGDVITMRPLAPEPNGRVLNC